MSENENSFIEGGSEAESSLESVNSPMSPNGAACDSDSCGINGCGCGEKKCKLPLIASLILVVALLVGGGFYFYQTVFANPVNSLLLAYANLYSSEEMNTESEIFLEVDKENPEFKNAFDSLGKTELKSSNEQLYNFFTAILPNFKIKYVSSLVSNAEKPSISQGFDILYKDATLVDASYSLKPWGLRVDSKNIFTKPLYVDIAKLVKDGTGGMYDLSKIHINDYIKIIREKDEFTSNLINSEYIKVLKEFLKTRVSKEGSKIVLQMTNKDSMDLFLKFLEIAKDDEILKKSVVTKTTNLLQFISDKKDYEAFGVSKEEFDTVASKIKVQIDTEYESVVGKIEEFYKSSANLDTLENVNKTIVKSVFTIKNRKIVATESSTIFNGVVFKVNSKYSDKVSILKALEEKTIENMDDISGFKENPLAVITLATTGISNFEKNVLKGESFKVMSEDIKNHAKEQLDLQDAARVIYLFDEIVPNAINKGLSQIFMGGF